MPEQVVLMMTPSEHAVACAANTKLADVMAVHDQLELYDEIKRILDSDQDVTVKNGIAIARPKGGSNWG